MHYWQTSNGYTTMEKIKEKLSNILWYCVKQRAPLYFFKFIPSRHVKKGRIANCGVKFWKEKNEDLNDRETEGQKAAEIQIK